MAIDPHSADWKAVKAHAEKEIERARERLEVPGLPAADTEHERGRIAALKKLLKDLPPSERSGT
jgi:hypothetical protein